MYFHIQFTFSLMITLITMKSLYILSQFLFLLDFIIEEITRKSNISMNNFHKFFHVLYNYIDHQENFSCDQSDHKVLRNQNINKYITAGYGNGNFLCAMRLNCSWYHFHGHLSYVFLVSVSV